MDVRSRGFFPFSASRGQPPATASRARGADIPIIDIAGRLHTKYNLLQELKKMRGVAAKNVHRAPHEILLVLDATLG